ncbi:MAG: hydantoinase/oxoprolinase family protein [Chloroflexota bacterium]
MGYIVNVDVGGTFMDFFVAKGGDYVTTKVPTTAYELGVGFVRGLEECAEKDGKTLEQFLAETDVIKYCTTIGTNILIEHTGPKLGLITTRGFEDTIFIGRGRQWADGLPLADVQDVTSIAKPEPLIPRKFVVGVRERIDYAGNVVMPLVKEDVLEQLRYLVDKGVRGFVVSLLWSFVNPVHERQIRAIIEEEFPEVYLGNMPIILSSEISPKEGEYVRTMTAIVNAYIHIGFVEQISALCSDLLDKGFKKPLLLCDNVGGCAKVARTKAIATYGASPVSGLCGAARLCTSVGLPNVVFCDTGGTSFDVGLITDGSITHYDLYPTVDRWRTQITAIKITSIGAGGGSIAWLNPLLGNRLEVGPASAKSLPGPACYDLGGENATVTDADVVLGYVNPDYFLGGKFKLNKEKAFQALKDMGKKSGWDEVTTAMMIKKVVDAKMGQEIFKEVALMGYEPADFTVFAGGGAGPGHCCGVAAAGDMSKIIVPPMSSVAGAYGASTLDVVHTYEKSRNTRLFDYAKGTYFNDYAWFNSIIEELRELAIKDIVLEGFKEEQATFRLELEMRYGMQWRYTPVESPLLLVHSEEDVKAVCDRFTEEFSRMYSPEAAFPQGGVEVETYRLFVYLKLPHFELTRTQAVGTKSAKDALKGQREAYWEKLGGYKNTNIYQWDLLKGGNLIEGPAIIESENTTVVIEPEWTFSMAPELYGIISHNHH